MLTGARRQREFKSLKIKKLTEVCVCVYHRQPLPDRQRVHRCQDPGRQRQPALADSLPGGVPV